jgi:hypothetical protein
MTPPSPDVFTARRPVATVNTLFLRRADFVKRLHPHDAGTKIGWPGECQMLSSL